MHTEWLIRAGLNYYIEYILRSKVKIRSFWLLGNELVLNFYNKGEKRTMNAYYQKDSRLFLKNNKST